MAIFGAILMLIGMITGFLGFVTFGGVTGLVGLAFCVMAGAARQER